MADDTVKRLRRVAEGKFDSMSLNLLREAADEIEQLRAHLAVEQTASHQMMWDETLIPIAEAFGVSIVDEYGENRRQFQMVEAIIEKARYV